MTDQEYNKRLNELRKEYQRKEEELNDLYAIDNNPYTVGSIFEDHIGKIKIEKIDTGWGHSKMPCCIYYGLELKKNGTPKKSGASREAWQCNDVKLKQPPAAVTA
jgi:hypothetical protein